MPVIVVSGLPGSGSSTISRELAKKFNIEYFSPGDYFKKFSKVPQSKSAMNVWQTEKGRANDFHKKIDDMQIEKAKKGNVVICGKLSIHFLKDLCKNKIWIEADIDTRTKRTAERDKISFEEAKRILQERENVERREWKRIYGFDYVDLKNSADLLFDNSNLTVDQAVEKIINFVKRQEG